MDLGRVIFLGPSPRTHSASRGLAPVTDQDDSIAKEARGGGSGALMQAAFDPAPLPPHDPRFAVPPPQQAAAEGGMPATPTAAGKPRRRLPIPWLSLAALLGGSAWVLWLSQAPKSSLFLPLPLVGTLGPIAAAALLGDWARETTLSVRAVLARTAAMGLALGAFAHALVFDPLGPISTHAALGFGGLAFFAAMAGVGFSFATLRAARGASLGPLGLRALSLEVVRRDRARLHLVDTKGARYFVEHPRQHRLLQTAHLEPRDQLHVLARVRSPGSAEAPYRSAAAVALGDFAVVADDLPTFRRQLLAWSLDWARWFGAASALHVAAVLLAA